MVRRSFLLGFQDFFRNTVPASKGLYGSRVGKEYIQRTCCLFLAQHKYGPPPTVEEVLARWYTYYGSTYQQSIAFGYLFDEYRRIVNTSGHANYSLFTEESLLNMFIWSTTANIPDDIAHEDGAFMVDLFKLNLVFNDEVLANYDKAETSAKTFPDRQRIRQVLASHFAQHDLKKIDYAQLVYAQIYKLMELLNFLENSPDYQKLFRHLLADFDCGTKEEFYKAFGGAIVSPITRGKNPTWSSLVIKDDADATRAAAFLDKLAFNPGELAIGPDDYKLLRDKPFQKLPEEYRIVFDLFLVKKLYNGIIFKLASYVNADKSLFAYDFFGSVRIDFSEEVLVYTTFDAVFRKTGALVVTGSQFKTAGLEREPDYYARRGNDILLFESKDFFMPAGEKLSYDFATIEAGFKKDGRLGKAVKQLCRNVQRTIDKELIEDTAYNPADINIFPVIVVHDSLYSCVSLNYWVNSWFQEEIDELRKDKKYAGYDFSRVNPVTVLEIDPLILYRSNLENLELDLFELIAAYQGYVTYGDFPDPQWQDMDRAAISFSQFMRDYANKKAIQLNLDLIHDIYNLSGYKD